MHVVGYVGTETNRKNTLQESLETLCSCFTLIITIANSQPLPPDTQVSSSLAITNVAFSLQVSSEYVSDVPFLFLSLFFFLSCFPLPSFPPSLFLFLFCLQLKSLNVKVKYMRAYACSLPKQICFIDIFHLRQTKYKKLFSEY